MAPSSSELISAVSHPTRRRILRAYLDDSLDCVSARELVPAVEQPVSQIAYHLKTLARCELLRPVQGERPYEDEPVYGWALDVEAEWLRLVLDVWSESGLSR
jgi:DNA-binding transcriptional ArsR family regulator